MQLSTGIQDVEDKRQVHRLMETDLIMPVGGIYAMDWRAEGICVWAFTRDNIPGDILAGNPTTGNWPLVRILLPNPQITDAFLLAAI